MYTRNCDSQTISFPRCEDEFVQFNVGSLIRKQVCESPTSIKFNEFIFTSSVKKIKKAILFF